MIKKIERVKMGGIDAGNSYKAADITPAMLEDEIGGIFIYLDLLSALLGINLEKAIVETFNNKSETYGFIKYLSPLLEEKERRIKELKETNEYLKSDNLKVYKENEQLQQQVKELEGLLLDIDKSLYLGEDLKDKEILDWYIEVTKTIKESIKEQKFNPQPSDIKTAEDVLDKYYQSGMHWKVVNRSRVLQAMKEYASQFRAVPDEAPYRVLLGGLDITKSCKIDG